MPLTFLSHQAVVLPLKLRSPRWFNGTALVIGSMAPDVEYFVRGIPVEELAGHTWRGQLTLCLPVTLVLYWVVTRIIAEPVAANLPDGGAFRLGEYTLLREQPATSSHWLKAIVSALIGSISHVVLDRATGGWAASEYIQRRSWLPPDLLPSDRAWTIAQVSVWLVLGAVTLLMLREIGRRGLLRRWVAARGEAAHPRHQLKPNRALFWTPVFLAAIAAIAWGATHPRKDYHLNEFSTWIQIGLRTVSCTFLAILIMSVIWQITARRSYSTLRSQT